VAGFAITAFKLKQHDRDLYMFTLKSDKLEKICYVTPRSKNDPREIQRILQQKRAKEIGEYIKTPTAYLPNSIVISLDPSVNVSDTGRDNEVTLLFPEEEGKFGYILDGQHRLAGFKHSDGVHFDLPVIAFYNADETLRGKIFADINSKQVKVTDTHLLEIYYQIKDIASEDSTAMDIVHRLNKDSDSPLQSKIKVGTDDKGHWATNKQLKNCVAPHITVGGVLHEKKTGDQIAIFKQYLRAVMLLYTDAWGDNKNYLLTKSMGIELMLGIFPQVKHRCDLNEGKQYTYQTFRNQLSVLVGKTIKLPNGGEIPLTWERKHFSGLTSSRGRTVILNELRKHLIKADEDEDE